VSDPIWVDERAVMAANHMAVTEFGGGPSSTVNTDRLSGALQRPQMAYHYRDPKPDIVELAAIYVHAICKAHAFVDGNKRTAFYACGIFLTRNGYAFDAADWAEAADFFAQVADDKNTGITEQHVADWIRRRTKPVREPVSVSGQAVAEVLRAESDTNHRYRITRTPRGILLSCMLKSQVGLLLGPAEWLYRTEEAAERGLKLLKIFNSMWTAMNEGRPLGDLPSRCEAATVEHKEAIDRLNDQPLTGREVRELRIMIEGDSEFDASGHGSG